MVIPNHHISMAVLLACYLCTYLTIISLLRRLFCRTTLVILLLAACAVVGSMRTGGIFILISITYFAGRTHAVNDRPEPMTRTETVQKMMTSLPVAQMILIAEMLTAAMFAPQLVANNMGTGSTCIFVLMAFIFTPLFESGMHSNAQLFTFCAVLVFVIFTVFEGSRTIFADTIGSSITR